jgi:hypothetical protein
LFIVDCVQNDLKTIVMDTTVCPFRTYNDNYFARTMIIEIIIPEGVPSGIINAEALKIILPVAHVLPKLAK